MTGGLAISTKQLENVPLRRLSIKLQSRKETNRIETQKSCSESERLFYLSA